MNYSKSGSSDLRTVGVRLFEMFGPEQESEKSQVMVHDLWVWTEETHDMNIDVSWNSSAIESSLKLSLETWQSNFIFERFEKVLK